MMTKHIDPVCGMAIDGARAGAEEKFGGQTYYFCSAHCRESFIAAPAAYLRARDSGPGAHAGHG